MFFPNLQVADVARTREFWTALGYSFNETYSAENLPSRDAVDTLVEGVLAGGGAAARPMEDLGFVDTRAFPRPRRAHLGAVLHGCLPVPQRLREWLRRPARAWWDRR